VFHDDAVVPIGKRLIGCDHLPRSVEVLDERLDHVVASDRGSEQVGSCHRSRHSDNHVGHSPEERNLHSVVHEGLDKLVVVAVLDVLHRCPSESDVPERLVDVLSEQDGRVQAHKRDRGSGGGGSVADVHREGAGIAAEHVEGAGDGVLGLDRAGERRDRHTEVVRIREEARQRGVRRVVQGPPDFSQAEGPSKRSTLESIQDGLVQESDVVEANGEIMRDSRPSRSRLEVGHSLGRLLGHGSDDLEFPSKCAHAVDVVGDPALGLEVHEPTRNS